MREWLAIAAVVLLVGSSAAEAQMKGLTATDVASVARTRTIDLTISQQFGNQGHIPLVPSMLVHQDFSSKAAVGLGFANIYAKRRGEALRADERAGRSRKPAVTFLLKF